MENQGAFKQTTTNKTHFLVVGIEVKRILECNSTSSKVLVMKYFMKVLVQAVQNNLQLKQQLKSKLFLRDPYPDFCMINMVLKGLFFWCGGVFRTSK